MSRSALALDIGGTKLAAGVVDETGRVHSFVVAPSYADRGPARGLERLFDLGRKAVDGSGVPWADIDAVGIGCGGPLDRTRGVLLSPPHLPGWLDVPVIELAQNAYDRPALLENDGTAAAAGEYRFGAGAGTKNMVYLTISTGVGGGVVLNGELYHGTTGNGSELGHITVDWDGRECRGCGRRGCLEAYVSGTSIAERANEAGIRGADPSGPTASEVAQAAAAGDSIATIVWETTVAALASGVTSIVNVFEPDAVVVGGGVSRAGEQLLAPVRERVREDAMGGAGELVSIVGSALGEHVGVVGAAAIAHDGHASRDGRG